VATEFRDYELYKRLKELYDRLDQTNTKLDTLDSRLQTTNSKLDTLNDTLTITNRRLTTLLQQDLILWRINQNGDVIYNDTFDGLELHWEKTEVKGGVVEREYDASRVYHGNASLKFTIGTSADSSAGILKYFTIPGDISGVGFEYSFMHPGSAQFVFVEAWITYYDGSNEHRGRVTYVPLGGVVQVVGSSTSEFSPKVNRSKLLWNRVKFTVDFQAGTFKDFWFNDVGADVSNVELYTSANSTEPCIMFTIYLYCSNDIGSSQVAWVDDFILSINEPKVF